MPSQVYYSCSSLVYTSENCTYMVYEFKVERSIAQKGTQRSQTSPPGGFINSQLSSIC